MTGILIEPPMFSIFFSVIKNDALHLVLSFNNSNLSSPKEMIKRT